MTRKRLDAAVRSTIDVLNATADWFEATLHPTEESLRIAGGLRQTARDLADSWGS